jgi:hypothetical protein
MLQNVKKALANPEPSTHDPKPTFDVLHFLSRLPGELPNCVPIMKGWNYIRPALPPGELTRDLMYAALSGQLLS